MLHKGLVVFSILFLVKVGFAFTQFENGEFDDFKQWLDNDGNPINVHHGGILYHEGKYWWYGQDHRPEKGGSATTVGVSMYSSTNLYDWNYEGVILAYMAPF